MASVINEGTQFFDEISKAAIVNGYIYIGVQNQDPTILANQITIYSDRDLTTPISNPQRTGSDGRSVNKIWVPGKYSMTVKNENLIQKLNDLDRGESPATGITNLTNVAGANTITADASPTITALVDKEIYNFTSIGTNTGAVTLAIDLVAAKSVLKYHDQPLVAGDIEINQNVAVQWNATGDHFQLLNPAQLATSSTAKFAKGADIPSATALVLGSDGNYFDVTGTAAAITGATQANPCVITALSHGFSTGDSVTIEDVVGMVELNGNTYTITVLTTDTFELDATDSTAFTAYTSGGLATLNITSIGTVGVGTVIKLHFDGIVNLRNHATDLVLPGSADITTEAGDSAEIIEYVSGDWRVNYERGNGRPLADPPFRGAMVHLVGDKTAVNITFLHPDWESESFDTDNIHDNTTNPNRLTVPANTSRIRLYAGVRFATNSTGIRRVFISKSGAATPIVGEPSFAINALSSGITEIQISSVPLEVTPGDWYDVSIYQNSGGNLTIQDDSNTTYFAMEIIE